MFGKNKSRKISLTQGEIPNFFSGPENYVPGFQSEPVAAKSVRNQEMEVTKTRWPGVIVSGEQVRYVNLDLNSPNFIAKAIAKVRRQEPHYHIDVKER